jgi:FtsZ-binding cell division protein ZapB
MDLHDLTEKAISATKQQGLLQMDDYDMLVGELKQIGMEENMSLDDEAKAYYLAKVKRGEIDTLPEDPKAAFLAQMTKDQMDHDKETLRRERGLEETIREIVETIKLGQTLNEELCEKGKRYIKARQAAGEKSSAYLSGRAVKVCKGSIEWPKKGKK